MNSTSKKFYRHRFILLIILLALSIVSSSIYSIVHSNNNIQKSNFTVCLNDDTEEVFQKQFNNKKKFYKYYNYNTSSNSKNSDFTFTSDIQMIDTSRDYSIEGYSPLVICLKDTKNLNNYLKTTTKEGFLTCDDNKIKNNGQDVINCDFLRIIEAVLNKEDWSNLGGEDKKITVYCPEPDTISGKLFYEFLLITINNGKYPTDNLEQVKEKADLFLNSENTIQADVCSKMSKLGYVLEEEDIYILFESDLLNETHNASISVAYPEITVIKELYLQYNNSDLQDSISKCFDSTSMYSSYLYSDIYYDHYYRNSGYKNFINRDIYMDIQKGFNYYKLTK